MKKKKEKNENIITKTLKIEIVRPLNIPWFMFNRILKDIARATLQSRNAAVRIAWEFDGHSEMFHKFYGCYPNAKDFFVGKKGDHVTLNAYIEKCVSEIDNISQTGNIAAMVNATINKYNEDKNKMENNEASLPNFKSGRIVFVKKDNLKRLQYIDKNNYCITVFLLNDKAKKFYEQEYERIREKYLQVKMEQEALENKNKKKRKITSDDPEIKYINDNDIKDEKIELKNGIQILFKAKSTYQKNIINHIINGKYKLCTSQIVQKPRKREWYLCLAYEFETEVSNELIEDNILGIDIGLNVPLYMYASGTKKYDFIKSTEIIKFQRKMFMRRKELQENIRFRSSNKLNRGIKAKHDALNKLGDKEARFRDSCNEKYSRFVIHFALKNKCKIIQMEKLSGVNEKNKFLKRWPYYDLQQKIEKKAKEKGIQVIYVDPQYTSQRCSKCGYIHKENRPVGEKGQAYFKCKKCGFKTNADYNAARNLSVKDIDKIIKEQLKKQKEELNHNLKYEAL